MDGIHDGSRLAYFLRLWDIFEECLYQRPFFLVVVGSVAISMILCGKSLDALATLALIGCLPESSSESLIRTMRYDARLYLLTGAAVLGLAFVLKSDTDYLSLRPDNSTSQFTSLQPQTSSRAASKAERELAIVFEAYLNELVRTSRGSVAVEYIPSGMSTKRTKVWNPITTDLVDDKKQMTFRVLMPDFYTRFVHYAHDSEAIFTELSEARTISVTPTDLLPNVFLRKPSPPIHSKNAIDYVCFELIRKLRSRPRTLQPSMTMMRTDIRAFRLSPMDAFVLQQPDDNLRRRYRSTVLKLLLANRYFGGSYRALTLLLFASRVLAWWSLATIIVKLAPLS